MIRLLTIAVTPAYDFELKTEKSDSELETEKPNSPASNEPYEPFEILVQLIPDTLTSAFFHLMQTWWKKTQIYYGHLKTLLFSKWDMDL